MKILLIMTLTAMIGCLFTSCVSVRSNRSQPGVSSSTTQETTTTRSRPSASVTTETRNVRSY